MGGPRLGSTRLWRVVFGVTPKTSSPRAARRGAKTLSITLLLAVFAAFAPSRDAVAQSAGISGERCYARVTRSKGALTLNPNQVGNFPTIDGRPQTAIKIEVIYIAGIAN